VVQRLREGGWRTDYAFGATKVGKQFQAAETLGARFGVLVGSEWPDVKVKNLKNRTEKLLAASGLMEGLKVWGSESQ
jgi:histidyl-tRNA synthetase